MPDHDADLGAIVAMLRSAGLLVQATEDGKPALQLTPKGAQVATQMAMSHEDEPSRCSTRCWMAGRPALDRAAGPGTMTSPITREEGT